MKDNKSLTTKLFFKGIILNVSIGIIILFYSIFIANIKIRMHYWYVILTIFLILFAEFCVSPFTNIIITARTSRKIREWKTKGYDKEQRTKLFLMIHRIPVYKQIECFLYFVACSFILESLIHSSYSQDFGQITIDQNTPYRPAGTGLQNPCSPYRANFTVVAPILQC